MSSHPPKLLLVPTLFELGWIADRDRLHLESLGWKVELCYFGPIASGIRTVQLLNQYRPAEVLLMGIAGVYPELGPEPLFLSKTLPPAIGTAIQVSHIGCYGIGVGMGQDFSSVSQLGFQQWPVSPNVGLFEAIELSRTSQLIPSSLEKVELVTTCSCSSSIEEAHQRLRIFPNAILEDMEGFSVALACQSMAVPLSIVRGVSNFVGDRDKANWQCQQAMQAAFELVRQVISQSSPTPE